MEKAREISEATKVALVMEGEILGCSDFRARRDVGRGDSSIGEISGGGVTSSVEELEG